MKRMRSVELFTGGGGLALALEAAKLSHNAVVELNEHACATLRANRPTWNVIEEDVRKVDFGSLGPADLVAGGPPCQPFSIGGKARGHRDSRDMFPQAVRAVRELQPRAFVFENVRGLTRAAFANYVEYIRLQLTYPDFPTSDNVSWQTNLQRMQKHHTAKRGCDGLVYNVSLHLADAADYGVPQRRHRVFFVGFRADIDAKWFFPSATCSRDELIRAKYITGEYWHEHGLKPPARIPEQLRAKVKSLQERGTGIILGRWKTVRDALVGLPDPRTASRFSNHVYQPGARSYEGHTGSPMDEPAKALKAGDHGVPGGENMLAYGNGQVRYFTVRECARLQCFPDDYCFEGAWSENMRQLGNAVPVDLAYAVIASVKNHLLACNGSRRSIQPSR